MRFTSADPFSVAIFVALVASVLLAFASGVYFGSLRLGGPAARRAVQFGIGSIAWLALLSAVVASGALERAPMPRLMVFFVASNAAGALFALSPAGGWVAHGLPLQALVGFQAFRLPLELVLHSWARQGTIPGSMTWTGANIDILSGAIALLVAPVAGRCRPAAWVANVVGFTLLVNVGRVAILSSPVPFAWRVEPPLQLAFHLPYAWIIPVCVSGALAGHILLTRALISGGSVSRRARKG